jgi:5-methylcytosine-specific restriction endonuclease McrA
MEIDHLVPRKYRFDSKALDDLLNDCLSPEEIALGFDIDAPRNLAPICRECNNDKRDESFEGVPKFTRLLRKAREKATSMRFFSIPCVQSSLQSMTTSCPR